MELAALGTPEMPLKRVRVPRQAATAAKAAIKKDLLQQNSRPGAVSVPPKPSSMTAAKASTLSAAKPASLKPKKKQQPKVLLCGSAAERACLEHALHLLQASSTCDQAYLCTYTTIVCMTMCCVDQHSILSCSNFHPLMVL